MTIGSGGVRSARNHSYRVGSYVSPYSPVTEGPHSGSRCSLPGSLYARGAGNLRDRRNRRRCDLGRTPDKVPGWNSPARRVFGRMAWRERVSGRRGMHEKHCSRTIANHRDHVGGFVAGTPSSAAWILNPQSGPRDGSRTIASTEYLSGAPSSSWCSPARPAADGMLPPSMQERGALHHASKRAGFTGA